ncbi:hypothetical protein DITRI_Ditri10aG0056900 [Diplodiscus trichospermus]
MRLPSILHQRNPNPFITTSELLRLMQWKLALGKWRLRCVCYILFLERLFSKIRFSKGFRVASRHLQSRLRAYGSERNRPRHCLHCLAAYAPETTPFVSDEAMETAIGNSKDSSICYFWIKYRANLRLQELSLKGDSLRPSDVERALWSSAAGVKLQSSQGALDKVEGSNKRKRKH